MSPLSKWCTAVFWLLAAATILTSIVAIWKAAVNDTRHASIRQWRVETPRFCGEFVSVDDLVTIAAPFLHRAVLGYPLDEALYRLSKWRNCKVSEINASNAK